jgi:hypothetical protein
VVYCTCVDGQLDGLQVACGLNRATTPLGVLGSNVHEQFVGTSIDEKSANLCYSLVGFFFFFFCLCLPFVGQQ